ncbi:hypothetical protein ACFLTZ_06935, partial [Chloroflexota bacterium]
ISSLSVTPNQVKPAEEVAISAVVTNSGGSKGTYTAILKVNGKEEARKEVTVDAGISQKVSFSVSKDIAATYEVDINGLTGSFVVKKEAVVSPKPTPTPTPTPTPGLNWWLIGSIAAAVVVIFGLILWLSVFRRRA